MEIVFLFYINIAHQNIVCTWSFERNQTKQALVIATKAALIQTNYSKTQSKF
jgi:hypothetical protein